jgi:ribonuclease P protein component
MMESRDFGRAQKQGERFVKGCLIANWLFLPEGASPRLGVITSKRVGPAVVRNRARRYLRESFRLHQHELARPIDLVLVARPSIAGKDFHGVEHDFLVALKQKSLLAFS